jgi:hypothetical protein
MLDKFYEHKNWWIFSTNDGLGQLDLAYQLLRSRLEMEKSTKSWLDSSARTSTQTVINHNQTRSNSYPKLR